MKIPKKDIEILVDAASILREAWRVADHDTNVEKALFSAEQALRDVMELFNQESENENG